MNTFPKPVLKEAIDTPENLFSSYEISRSLDLYDELLEELFLIRNPQYKFNPNYTTEFQQWKAALETAQPALAHGMWAYFPWSKIAVRVLPDAEHLELRTARNKNLITKEEQEKFYNSRIAVAGLSVGSHGALTLALMGGARTLFLADPDTISGSNLNRIRYDYTTIGRKKAEVAAEYIYQLNPYAEVHLFSEGVSAENIDTFLGGDEKVQLLVEELDNLEMKVRLRLAAKEKGIPVIMATDNGDGIIMDIERYDLNPNTELFNGALGHLTMEEFSQFTPSDLPKLATKVAGVEVVVPRMLLSLKEVGKTLYSWPQLGDAATLSGVAIAYIARKIILGEPVRDGKHEINLDAIFDAHYDSAEAVAEREQVRSAFKQALGL